MEATKKYRVVKEIYSNSMIEADVSRWLKINPISDATKNLYEVYLRQFFNWSSSEMILPENVSQEDVVNWLGENRGWSNSTKYNAVMALRMFYKWQFGEENTVCKMRIRKTEAGPQRTLDQDELGSLLRSIDQTTTKGLRDLAIVSLMADTGLRATEVCILEVRYLDFKKSKLSVPAKGGVWTDRLFFEFSSECLRKWLDVRSKVAASNCKTVFVCVGGKTPGREMTRYGLHSLFLSLGKKAELDTITPHTMRRTFATIAIENGAPSRMVQIAGGWKNIAMVERYTQRLKADEMRQYSPVDRIFRDQKDR